MAIATWIREDVWWKDLLWIATVIGVEMYVCVVDNLNEEVVGCVWEEGFSEQK